MTNQFQIFEILFSASIHCQEAMDLEPLSFLATQEILSVPWPGSFWLQKIMKQKHNNWEWLRIVHGHVYPYVYPYV